MFVTRLEGGGGALYTLERPVSSHSATIPPLSFTGELLETGMEVNVLCIICPSCDCPNPNTGHHGS